MNVENPTLVAVDQSRKELHTAPDWDAMATDPVTGWMLVNVPFMQWWVFIIPMQLGPSTLMSYFFAISPTLLSSRAPSFPSSLNPAVMTTTDFTPLIPASSITAGTSVFGTHMMAWSSLPGMAVNDVYARSPRISSALGLIGYSFPRNFE